MRVSVAAIVVMVKVADELSRWSLHLGRFADVGPYHRATASVNAEIHFRRSQNSALF